MQVSPRSTIIAPISRAPRSIESRSFSKISAPSKPAAATARNLESSAPLIETVAIEVFIPGRSAPPRAKA